MIRPHYSGWHVYGGNSRRWSTPHTGATFPWRESKEEPLFEIAPKIHLSGNRRRSPVDEVAIEIDENSQFAPFTGLAQRR
jgi:hypothetical protein